MNHMGLHTSDYATMVLYLLAVVALGAWFSRGEQNTETYLLGGRSMRWWVVGISYMVSLLSTASIVSIPGYAYAHGVTMALKMLLVPVVAVGAFYIFTRFYFRSGTFTPFQYLESRFDGRVRALAAGLYLVTRISYLAVVLFSSAIVFEGTSNWPAEWTILLIGTIGIGYTVVGGIRAVIWTDFTQFLILVVGLGIVVFKSMQEVPGGAVGIVEYAFQNGRGMPELTQASFWSFDPHVDITLWMLIGLVVGHYFFYSSSDQIAIQRLLSTSGYQQAKRSLFMAVALNVVIAMMLWFLGLAMFAFYAYQPPDLQPSSPDLALFQFISTELPSPLPGLILSAMLAAVMSTLDSGMNSLATVATKDFYLRFYRPSASEHVQVRFSRWMTLIIGLFSVAAAIGIARVSKSVGSTIMEAAGVFMALMNVLPPIFLLGMTSRRATAGHALMAALVGWAVTVAMTVWYFSSQTTDQPISFLYVGSAGLVVTLIVGCSLAWFAKPLPADQLEQLTLWTWKKDEAHDE